MPEAGGPWRALISSDWNECLAPSGPFDAIAHAHPRLAPALEEVFRAYTANRIPLGRAAARIAELLPAPLSAAEMDAYLKSHFRTYPGVPALIDWCRRQRVLFMINTTGSIGYFQRALALGLLPPVPVLSAHPLVRYPARPSDPGLVLELYETADKGRHTAAAARAFGVPFGKVAVLGDSGGDGPHFAWARKAGALRVACMPKASLEEYCRGQGIEIDLRFGDARAPQAADFTRLAELLSGRFGL